MEMRCSYGGGFLAKMVDLKGECPAMLRKSCVVPPASKFPRSRSVCDREISVSYALHSPFKSSANKSNSPPPPCLRTRKSNAAALVEDERDASKMASPKHEKPDKNSTLPGILGTLNKEAMQQWETAQKIALQALKEATATETVVRHLRLLLLSVCKESDIFVEKYIDKGKGTRFGCSKH